MKRLHGLYAITSEALCVSQQALLAGVEAALRGGAALIQYRDKWSAPEAREARARALLALCRDRGVPLIINDDVALAARVGADGVHVGSLDLPVADARSALGPQALVGMSCASDLARALRACADGADYVAFGRFFASRTKPGAPAAKPGVIEDARRLLQAQTSICAIGGITPENAQPLIDRGADLIAAVDGVFNAADVKQAAQRYAALFKQS